MVSAYSLNWYTIMVNFYRKEGRAMKEALR